MSLPIRENELSERLRAALARAGEAEVEIYAKALRRGFARFAIGELGQHMDLDEPFVLVRVARGSKIAETRVSNLDERAIAEAIQGAAKAAELLPENPDFAGFASADEPEGARPPRFSEATAESTPEARAEALAPVLERIRKAGLVSAGSLDAMTAVEAVVTTGGLARTHASTTAAFQVWALETAGAGGASGYGHACHRDISKLDLVSEAEAAIRHAQLSKDPIALDAGAYDVVLAAPAMASVLDWLSGISFGAREFHQGTSALSGRIGERITGEKLSVTEDPLDASELGFGTPFDREGTWRRKVRLLDRGIGRGILYDRTWGKRFGEPSTGSAALSFFSDGAPAASALHVAPGEASSVEELLSGIERGLYIRRLHYVNGLLEPRRAVMTGLTRDGTFLVEKGRIVRAVGSLRFTDSMTEAFARLDGLSRERWALPSSWAEGEAIVTPAARIRGLVFTSGSQKPVTVAG